MDQMVCFEAQRTSPLLKRINDFASLQLIYTDKFFLQLGIKYARMSAQKFKKWGVLNKENVGSENGQTLLELLQQRY